MTRTVPTLRAAQHERSLRAAEARQRWIAWLCAVALAAGIWWGTK